MTVQLAKPPGDTAQKCDRVAVFLSVDSAEREVSLTSSNTVFQALSAAGMDTILVDLGKSNVHRIADFQVDFDCFSRFPKQR